MNFSLPAGLILVDATRPIIRCKDCDRQAFADEVGGERGRIPHMRNCRTKSLQPLTVDAETGTAVPECQWARLPSGGWGLRGPGLVTGQKAVAVSRSGERQDVVVGVVVEERDGVILAYRATEAEIPALQAIARGEVAAPVAPTGVVEECLECGVQYQSYGNLGPGGMSCRRCR